MQTSQILHKSALKTLAPSQEDQKPKDHIQQAHFDEFVYSRQVTLPEESEQLRLHCHSATAPGAQLLTLMSSSALHRPRCLKNQTSSGYIAIRLERHQGHSARSPVAHSDELICSAQAMLPQELDQLRLHRHSAGTPPRPQC